MSRPVKLSFGSLFAGIGGLDLGMERAGMTCKWQVEVDSYARQVLAKHWPTVRRFGDIRRVAGFELEHVDLICGGFPCQDISLAGRGAGIDGERSGLWSEYRRIVGLVRPRFVLVENVPALNHRGLDRVLRDFWEVGYHAEWDCIPASAIGAPHRRDRIFIVATRTDANSKRFAVKPQFDRESRQRRPGRVAPSSEERAATQGPSDAIGDGLEGLGPARTAQGAAIRGGSWWATEPGMGRVADGVPHRVDRLRVLGNAVVPQVAHWIGLRILSAYGHWGRRISAHPGPGLHPLEHER